MCWIIFQKRTCFFGNMFTVFSSECPLPKVRKYVFPQGKNIYRNFEVAIVQLASLKKSANWFNFHPVQDSKRPLVPLLATYGGAASLVILLSLVRQHDLIAKFLKNHFQTALPQRLSERSLTMDSKTNNTVAMSNLQNEIISKSVSYACDFSNVKCVDFEKSAFSKITSQWLWLFEVSRWNKKTSPLVENSKFAPSEAATRPPCCSTQPRSSQ